MNVTAELETPPDTPHESPVRDPGGPPVPLHEPDPDPAPSERRKISLGGRK